MRPSAMIIFTRTHILANDDDKRLILIATSPEDDSTRVPVDSDIILKFNKAVNCESGTINIESDDNSSSFAVNLPNEIDRLWNRDYHYKSTHRSRT